MLRFCLPYRTKRCQNLSWCHVALPLRPSRLRRPRFQRATVWSRTESVGFSRCPGSSTGFGLLENARHEFFREASDEAPDDQQREILGGHSACGGIKGFQLRESAASEEARPQKEVEHASSAGANQRPRQQHYPGPHELHV